MKKTVLFFVLVAVVVFSVITGCKKNSPTTPAASNTPNYTQTYIALFTHTITPTRTVSPTTTATSTITMTPTSTSTTDYSVLVSVPGGIFTQPDGTNNFNHTISVFKIGKYLVTYGLWYTVCQWAVGNGYSFANAGTEGCCGSTGLAPTAAKFQPVTDVNWRDTIVWCNAYSQMSGLTPAYCSDASFITPVKISSSVGGIDTAPGSVDNPYVNWTANGFRLPTEGEYQYAASYVNGSSWLPYDYASGATDNYTDAMATGLVAWYSDNCNSTQAVGGKTPNALGIYDMSGNVWEACWDWYGSYPTTVQTNYRGSASGSYRVLRGGGYDGTTYAMQVGERLNISPWSNTYLDAGFRFARTY